MDESCNKYSLSLHIAGYVFNYIQELNPERSADYGIKEYYPQNLYENRDNLELSKYGAGAFCRFSLDAPSWRGVYIWVSDGEIIYIGETENLSQRFNMGYGIYHLEIVT